MKIKGLPLATGVILMTITSVSWAGAIVSGFDANTLGPNDDGSTSAVSTGFTLNFFGQSYDELYVNNNGNVTFAHPLDDYTPDGLTTHSGNPIIAPFFADVDTRDEGDPVTYGTGTFHGHNALGVNWLNVSYYDEGGCTGNTNSFQLLLVNRADTGAGNFDIIFNYGSITWDSGEASSGNCHGLGGQSAHVGYSNGTGDAGTFFELAGSGVNGAFLDSNHDSGLIYGSRGSDVDGRYVFNVRNGVVTPEDPTSVPGPSALLLMGAGLIGLGLFLRSAG